MSILEAVDLYRFYHVADEEVRALRGVSLDLAPGELVALLGASGSGKSTLLSCLAGLDDPDGGAVTVAGERLTRRPEAQRAGVRARHLGVMLQGGNLLAHLNVLDNVTLTGQLLGQPDEARALDLLGQLGLDHRRHAFPAQLSGGEVARVSLAAALAHRPAALLADEPTAEVDAATEERVIGVIEAFVRGEGRGGRGAVIATHSPRLAARAGRVLRLKDGRWQDA
ncbi:ABC transporter ATP-binding protein (plasmid) [Deinococcus aetherius]|uniref:ABC transporter ATP-binding protein n=1 Tax=Deinococcus aetherius TaxID=200252 RepID=A0ABM8AL98_9DEIO|nr:ATP-binding cassette domain-containing protein [Deinococcus aetherius]BDP44616.1 ABC transporter ATP-binding protein [Deinococcus aetherius]